MNLVKISNLGVSNRENWRCHTTSAAVTSQIGLYFYDINFTFSFWKRLWFIYYIRYPFKSFDGRRSCCGSQIFDTTYLKVIFHKILTKEYFATFELQKKAKLLIRQSRQGDVFIPMSQPVKNWKILFLVTLGFFPMSNFDEFSVLRNELLRRNFSI